MILKSLNKLDPKFGFPNEVQYEDPSFHGHQKGMCIALKNLITGKIESNYLSKTIENRDELLNELLSTEGILLVESRITQLDPDTMDLVPKMLYYLPYAVIEHSIFKPTLNDVNVTIGSNDTFNRFDVEILFVKDNLNRYITVTFEKRYASMFESVDEIFKDVFFTNHFDEDHELYKAGIRWQDKTEESKAGYYLDFYNEAGESFLLGFTHIADFKDAIASIRLINHVLILNKEGE